MARFSRRRARAIIAVAGGVLRDWCIGGAADRRAIVISALVAFVVQLLVVRDR